MLVLSRMIDEDVVIVKDGVEICLRVVGVKNGKVRLGIEAPLDFLVHRREVWLAILRDREVAQQAAVGPVVSETEGVPS